MPFFYLPSEFLPGWREYRRQGWATLGYHLLRRILDRLRLARFLDLRVCHVVAVAPWHLRLPPRLPRELAVRELSQPDLDELSRLRPANGLGYARRLAAGHRAYGAFFENRLAAFVWVCGGPGLLASSFGALWQLGPGMAWLYDLYSDPAVLGAMAHLYAYLRQHPPGDACRQLVGQNEYDNLRSRLAHRRLGYRACATVGSLHLGGLRWCVSRDAGGQWRWRRRQSVLPVGAWAPALGLAAHDAAGGEPGDAGVRAQCRCGRAVSLESATGGCFVCACGAALGRMRADVAELGEPSPYWGEISSADMRAVLRRAAVVGWRTAVEERVPSALHFYIASRERDGFQEVIPLPPEARVLDVGAGWGAISAGLARRYPVVALEGVRERAQFIALRAKQEGLARLRVVNGDLRRTVFAPGQFDLIVVNGVLEWVGMFDHSVAPATAQLMFLDRLRLALAPGGRIYIGIENRFGWTQWRGGLDHSGLRYTSLLPRPLARWVCARSPRYRSRFNTGYRTYTYSHRGYARLFEQVGLRIHQTWISPEGYNTPIKLVPLDRAAIRFSRRTALPAASWRGRLHNMLRDAASHERVWRWLGSDFAFLLEPEAEATSPHARPVVPPAAVPDRVARA